MAAEDEPTTRIAGGRAPTGPGEEEEPTLPIPADAVHAALAQHGAPEYATVVVPPPQPARGARGGRSEQDDLRATLSDELGDGSIEVAFDKSGAAVAQTLGRPRPRRSEHQAPSAVPQEEGDASVDVVFDPTTGELLAKEVARILSAVSPVIVVEPPNQALPRESDPDVHGAEIEYDPDKTRGNRR